MTAFHVAAKLSLPRELPNIYVANEKKDRQLEITFHLTSVTVDCYCCSRASGLVPALTTTIAEDQNGDELVTET